MSLNLDILGRALFANFKAGEIWFIHPTRPEYCVSEDGEIGTVTNGKFVRLRGSAAGDGYRCIMLKGGGRVYKHRMICEAIHGPAPTPKHQARHLNGIKADCSPDNLAWGTPVENAADKLLHGTNPVGERNAMSKLTASKVAEMREIRKANGLSHKKIAKQFGVTAMTAWRAIEGVSWK